MKRLQVTLPPSRVGASGADVCASTPLTESIDPTLRIAVVALSSSTPLTLQHSLRSWSDSGLLQVVDDALLWLNAATPCEVEAAAGAGFRVVALTNATLADRVAARTGNIPAHAGSATPPPGWPFPVYDSAGRPSLRVGLSQWFAMHETGADIVLFLEKDFIPPPHLQFVELVRALATAVATLQSGAAAVRLRRYDDPDRFGIFNCCLQRHREGLCNVSLPCRFESHLAWQLSFCAPNDIDTASQGHIRECLSDMETLRPGDFRFPLTGDVDYSTYSHTPASMQHWMQRVAQGGYSPHLHSAHALSSAWKDDELLQRVTPEPLRLQCTSFAYSQWTNNPALFLRMWWLQNLGKNAAWTRGDFELSTIAVMPECDKQPHASPITRVCTLFPGLFWHVEVDGR